MTWLPQIKWRILVAMRELGGAQSHFVIAERIGEAPFRVRAELGDLRRMRYVHRTRDYSWELTEKAEQLTWASRQEEMPV